MASLGDTSVVVPCPACREPLTLPVRETGRDGPTITVDINTAPLQQHVLDAHQESSR